MSKVQYYLDEQTRQVQEIHTLLQEKEKSEKELQGKINRISGGNHTKSDQGRVIRWIERNVEALAEN